VRQVRDVPSAVRALSERLVELGWVSDLLVGGSLATGDFVAGVSDVDLVAIVTGPVSETMVQDLISVHHALETGVAAGADLGCVYVEQTQLERHAARHPTWTHGRLIHRALSGISRAELVRYGFAVFGRPPTQLLRPVTDDDVRRAAHDEICGYWALASRRPWWWLSRSMVDLGLTSMARGRHTLRTGELLTKTDAIEQVHAPDWLVDDLRARRRGETVRSPRVRSGFIAWRDARRTVRAASMN
jgi:hypothetical protein